VLRIDLCVASVCLAYTLAWAGPYPGAAAAPGSTAIAMDDATLLAWATGYVNYQPGSQLDVTWQTPSKALGPATGDVFDIVSLGNGGQITLAFAHPIANGPGYDFAVFENGVTDTFLELAWVELSADGVNFLRLPNDSLTVGPVSAYGTVDPTNLDGLAGKYRIGYGTPFDLSAVGLSRASHIRLVDIVGDGSAHDTSGDVIYDPHLTTGSAGFDLEAVGVLHEWLYMAGDAGGDSAINALDISPFVLALTSPDAYANQYGHPPEAADMNADGQVNALDIALFVSALVGAQSVGVPEPTAAAVIGAGILLLAARHRRRLPMAVLVAMAASAASASAVVVDFEDLAFPPAADHWSGSYPSDGQGGTGSIETFSSRGVLFDTFSDGDWFFWNGFAYSRATDNTTPGYGNQYSSITGSGAGGSAAYAVGNIGISLSPRLTLAQPATLAGAYVTNTTYAYLSLRDGDMFARPLGDSSATPERDTDQPGWFTLIATGLDSTGQQTARATLDLASYRQPDGNPSSHIVAGWVWLDLSSLGTVTSVEFTIDASDGGFGWPQYFALDNLTFATAVPEPSCAVVLSAIAALALLVRPVSSNRRADTGDRTC